MELVSESKEEIIGMFPLAAKNCIACDRQRGGRFTPVPLAEALEALKTREILAAAVTEPPRSTIAIWHFHFKDDNGVMDGYSMDSSLKIAEARVLFRKTWPLWRRFRFAVIGRDSWSMKSKKIVSSSSAG